MQKTDSIDVNLTLMKSLNNELIAFKGHAIEGNNAIQIFSYGDRFFGVVYLNKIKHKTIATRGNNVNRFFTELAIEAGNHDLLRILISLREHF